MRQKFVKIDELIRRFVDFGAEIRIRIHQHLSAEGPPAFERRNEREFRSVERRASYALRAVYERRAATNDERATHHVATSMNHDVPTRERQP